MFGIGLPEFAVLGLLALLVFGPDKLPDVARQAARLVNQGRAMANNARAQVSKDFPELANVDLRDLNARTLIQKHLLDDLDDDDEASLRPGQKPLKRDETPPYDAEAT